MDLKKPKTFDEQIDKLIEHGCAFMDRAQAVKTLKQANYYRLSAYFLPFKERDNSTYKAGTNFEKIYDIYEFDQRIAILLYDLIEEIEVFIKTQIAYQHSMKYGAVGYLDPNNFISSKAEKHQNLINIFQNELKSNKDILFVKHHNENYDGKFPLWVAVELFTMGNISQFYSQMKGCDKKSVCKNITELTGYTYQYYQLESLLFCLTYLRNKCAHFSRLYYFKFGTIPKYPIYVTQKINIDNNNIRLYQYLHILRLLSPNPKRWNEFVTELEAIMDEYSDSISLAHIGFPENWRSELTAPLTEI